MPKSNGAHLEVRKMYKLFINGAFVRSESGRSDPLWDGKSFGANIARASRKDARDAVSAARSAFGGWSARTPANRGLVLYRLAEMLEGRRGDLAQRVAEGLALNSAEAQREVVAAIDRTIWYAGWCDKYGALLSTRNPVAGPHFNVSSPEPVGVVAVLAPDRPALLGLLSVLLPPLVTGNAVVLVAGERDPRTAVVFAEALATADVPPGVVNILTGTRDELGPGLASHMDVNAISFENSDAERTQRLECAAANTLKRVHVYPARARDEWFLPHAQSLDELEAMVEIKTIWHPVGA